MPDACLPRHPLGQELEAEWSGSNENKVEGSGVGWMFFDGMIGY